MISDVLDSAIENIDDYLNDDNCKDVYRGAVRERILKVRKDMAALSKELAALPEPDETPPVGFRG